MSSRHRFFVSAERIEGAGVRFTAQQARQIATVLRMQSGERVAVFDGLRPADAPSIPRWPAKRGRNRTR